MRRTSLALTSLILAVALVVLVGCSGLVYQLYFDERTLDGDAVRAFSTGDPQMPQVEVVVDRMSVPYLSGATIDFADTIEKQGFTIDNPNATGTCACGESFH